jgi:hypothetical protein
MKRKYFTIRKYMGDDLYSWAVFRKGQSEPVCTGCAKGEATYRANTLEKALVAHQSIAATALAAI